MADYLFGFLAEYWPMICAGLAGIVIGFICYLRTRLSYKIKLAEADLANAELQKAIIDGSYILCPNCGTKIYLKNVSIHTGGLKDENETKSE